LIPQQIGTDGLPASERSQSPREVVQYHVLMQLFAAAGIPMREPRIRQLARDVGLRAPDGGLVTEARIEEWTGELLGLGHLERFPEGLQCAPMHGFAAFREGLLGGRLREWRRPLLALLQGDALRRFQYPLSFGQLVALLRITLCAELHEQQRRELLRQYRVADPARVYLAAFGSPFDAVVVERIPADERDAVVEGILARSLHEPNPSAREALVWAQLRSTASDASAELRYRTCEQLLWQGRNAADVRPLLLDDKSARGIALHAAAAAFAGEVVDATRLYELAERLFRDEERARGGDTRGMSGRSGRKPAGSTKSAGQSGAVLKLQLARPMAFARVATLLAADTADTLHEARRRCLDEVRSTTIPTAADSWRGVASAIEARGTPQSAPVALTAFSDDAFASLMSLAASSWAQLRTLDEAQRRTFDGWAQAYETAGYQRAALELQAGLAIIGNRVLEEFQKNTFTALFAEEQPWRRTLAALAAVIAPPKPPRPEAEDKPKRNVWMIELHGPGSTPAVSVREQTQLKGGRGWSRGRALAENELANPNLPEQDAAVLSALPPEARQLFMISNGAAYSTEAYRVLPALVGHPSVVFADAPFTVVQVIRATPALLVERRPDGGVRLRLPTASERREFAADDGEEYEVRAPYGASAMGCMLTRHSATRASVLQLTRAHRHIIDLIGLGLDIPGDGVEAARDFVAAVAELFEVHSQIATAVPETAADATIRAELSAVGSGLRLRLTVQPFAEGGPRYVPGVGGERVITELNGEPRAVLRDLDAERRGMQSVLTRLPMLDGGDACEWTSEDPERCLAIVSELQSVGEGVRVEWPAGKKIQVTRRYRTQDFRIQIGAEAGRDWFAVAGQLALDDGTVLPLQRLIELTRANGGRFLPLGDAGFLALSAGLRRRLDELALSGTEQTDGSRRVAALAAGSLAETLEDAVFDADPEWHARLERLHQAQGLEVGAPVALRAELRTYQREGFQWLARLAHWGAGACLADDMGLGKTVQAIALLLHRAAGGAAMVVAPTSVCPNWLDEIRRFAPTLNIFSFGGAERDDRVASAGAFDVVVVSYALLLQGLGALSSRRWHTLVLDEAQVVKNFATKRAQAVLKLSADFRLATTGTPVENRLDELWMLFRFLNPGLLGSREHFNERYAGPIERRQDAAAHAALKRLVAPFLLRRTKDEVLGELPPRAEIVHLIEPSERERAFHEALRRSAVDAIASGALPPEQRRFRVLVELTRMRRACCDPRLVAGDTGIDGLPGAKLEAFAELALELAAGGHRALVFSQFVDYLKILRDKLDALGLKYQYLDGSTAATARMLAVRSFQSGDGDFFLLSLKAGGVGLNLTAADYVIIADPWWNPAVEDQAAGRAHRMGQQRPVTVYRLVIKDSIEERIMSLHRDKRALAEGLFSGEEFGKALSVDELTALLREG